MDRLLLSVVTGTFNRLQSLKNMMESVRKSIPIGIPFEFVIVDGGSNDGTLEWLKTQDSTKVVAQGKLLGAIKAFTDGALAASGKYVLLANDDVVFARPDSIMRAITHLDTHEYCGGVAFADNRAAPGYSTGYKVQNMRVQKDGYPTNAIYAQVGLFRKVLGDEVGWWGANDPCMSQAAGTYGGDNWLSARILELGYSIDAVAKVICNDITVEDELRSMNSMKEEANSGGYYKCYPDGPILPNGLPSSIENNDLKILYLPIYEKSPDSQKGQVSPLTALQKRNKQGLFKALSKVAYVWELDYVNYPFDLPEIISIWKPDILLTQIQGVNEITKQMLADAKVRNPEMMIVNWNGDAHLDPLISEPMIDLLREVDLQLVVNASVLPYYKKKNINAAYWQIGYETPTDAVTKLEHFDVVFQGNCYSKPREELETALRSIPDVKVGMFGSGWQETEGQTLYDFTAGESVYKASTIAIGDHFDLSENSGYISNRVIQALGAGSFLLLQETPELERWTKLKDGTHYVSWKDTDDLKLKIVEWLKPANKKRRDKIAANGHKHVMSHFTFDILVDQLLLDIIPNIGG